METVSIGTGQHDEIAIPQLTTILKHFLESIFDIYKVLFLGSCFIQKGLHLWYKDSFGAKHVTLIRLVNFIDFKTFSLTKIIKTTQRIHIISFEPISSRSSANSFHELSMNSVSIDVIGEFWWVTKRKLVGIVWIDRQTWLLNVSQFQMGCLV